MQRGSHGDTVMVVGADGKVAPRAVKVGSAEDGQWIVLDGLKPGEQVMVDGFQKLRGRARRSSRCRGSRRQRAGAGRAGAAAAPAASAASAPS